MVRSNNTGVASLALISVLLGGCLGGVDSDDNTAVIVAEEPVLNCQSTMDETLFANPEELRALMTKLISHGELRTTGSEAEQQVIDWVETELQSYGGFEITSQEMTIPRWQPIPDDPDGAGRSLALAGQLSIEGTSVPVAGAVPFSLPTDQTGMSGELVYVPNDQPIGPEHAGKVILRDIPKVIIPNAYLTADAFYLAPDRVAEAASGYYIRPYLSGGAMHQDMILAGQAGAMGVVFAFDVPREQVEGYFDPHNGTIYHVPAVFVGVDEAEQLKAAANGATVANVSVQAERDTATTRNLIARLPGESDERLVFFTNTDGNTWVQDNGVVGMLALAKYFSAFPEECRSRTIELAFTTGHLQMSVDGSKSYIKSLDEQHDDGTVALAFALEHLGAKEILPVPRDNAPGNELQLTGKPESTTWFVAEGHDSMADIVIDALQAHDVSSMNVLPGVIPKTQTHPTYCSFGGIGTYGHTQLVPSMAIISGPWSLWAPSFGEEAIDFEQMHKQLLAVGDVTLRLDDLTREEIAGPYLAWREARAEGGPVCPLGDESPAVAPL